MFKYLKNCVFVMLFIGNNYVYAETSASDEFFKGMA
jgi:hypothetical protein